MLGPLEVRASGAELSLGGRKQQAVLALLLLNANEVVSVERLIDEIWGERAPKTARNTLQAYISRLRKLLDGRIVTRGPGYLICLDPEEFDLLRFERLAQIGHEALSAGDASFAGAKLREALGLWRSAPLAELEIGLSGEMEKARLDQRYLSVLEERIEADLALARHREVIGELESLVAANPLRERLCGHLMLALYRSGRQAEALELYREARRRLVDALGLEPSPLLQKLHQAVLSQDAELDAPTLAHKRVPEQHPLRKRATVLLAGLGLPPGLDPEVTIRRRARVLERVTAILEGHEATVEDRVGEGIVGIFGLPVAHEDDALRAARAALEIRDSLAQAGVALRIGLETGDVIAEGESVLEGDALGESVWLKETAKDGDVLIGRGIWQLVHDVAAVERVAPDGPWRLFEVSSEAEGIQRHFDTPIVGRETELDQLRQAFGSAVQNRSCHLVTILGPPGIGKSRLAQELGAVLASEAMVVTGRCLSYGEGITFWPMLEIVKRAAGDTTVSAVRRILGDEEHARQIAEQVSSALGSGPTADSGEDTFWAFRRVLEGLARKSPLVVVFEDIHWAEPRLLDFVEHVADWSRDAPMLVLCLSRPELLDERPSWGGGKLNATSLFIEPLSNEDSEALVDVSEKPVSVDDRSRIIATAEGNPLFIEQMVALVGEHGAPAAVPPTIHAVLDARLDRLEPTERTALGHASVIGVEFWESAAIELSPTLEQGDIRRALQRLVRKDLIRPTRSELLGEEAFRFRHILIRDAAYESLLKETRAELHEKFADWLQDALGERATEVEEILGYHLEQAYRFRAELELDGAWQELATRAGEHLAAAGERALLRSDMPAASALYSRALELLPDDWPERGDLLLNLAGAFRGQGDWTLARACFDSVRSLAGKGDPALQARVEPLEARLRFDAEPDFTVAQLLGASTRSLNKLVSLGDDLHAARVQANIAWACVLRGQMEAAEKVLDAIEVQAQRDPLLKNLAREQLLPALWLYGPLPVPESRRRCEELLGTKPALRVTAACYRSLAVLGAMVGNFEEARRLLERDTEILNELGLSVLSASASLVQGAVELLANEPQAAEEVLSVGLDKLSKFGQTLYSTEVASLLARALCGQARYEEAWRITESVEILGDRDVSASVCWFGTRGKLLAGLGQDRKGARLARHAVQLAGETDMLDLRGDSLLDLSEALRLGAKHDEARAAAEKAMELYERKGNLVSAARARAALRESGVREVPA